WNPASVIYRRAVFQSMVGFRTCVDPTTDYDVYLRIAKHWPIYCHPTVVSEYRRHKHGMSANTAAMLRSERAVLRSHRVHAQKDRLSRDAYNVGIRQSEQYYAGRLLRDIAAGARAGAFAHVVWTAAMFLRYGV